MATGKTTVIKALHDQIGALQKKAAELIEENGRLRGLVNDERAKASKAEESLKESREHFADLKERLHDADVANQFMRGYLARVSEDDTVREEMLTVGEPGGEQRLVPKRKPTAFTRPSDFTEPRHRAQDIYSRLRDGENRKPRHWITY